MYHSKIVVKPKSFPNYSANLFRTLSLHSKTSILGNIFPQQRAGNHLVVYSRAAEMKLEIVSTVIKPKPAQNILRLMENFHHK